MSVPDALLDHPGLDAVLATAASLLGMEVVFVGGLTDDTFTFSKVHAVGDPWPEVVEGARSPRADSMCQRMLDGAPPATADAGADGPYADARVRTALGIRSYVGVAVRDGEGKVVATLCGLDRGPVEVDEAAVSVLTRLAEVLSTQLAGLSEQGVVVRRSAGGGWSVDGQSSSDDLTSAMVLADLLAEQSPPTSRPPRPDRSLDEVGQLRLSVTQLQHALTARVVVEQAIGVLAERRHEAPRQAFESLRRVARAHGRKVHDLSVEVVRSATDPSVPVPPELAGPR